MGTRGWYGVAGMQQTALPSKDDVRRGRTPGRNYQVSTTIHDILDELYTASTSERDKGERFERLMAAYLRTDVTWSDRFSNVWLWSDWPAHHGPDTGIDLVAEERETGDLTAIQCKFYAPTHTLQRGDIDSFFTASGKAGFTARMVVSTTDKWSKHAEDALEGQQIPVTRLRVQDLDDSSIDWSQFSLRTPEVMELKDKKVLRPHQKAALSDAAAGFRAHDRGKLIMACGTGKTFTSLRIAEDLVAPGGSVLFLVPSISLLSQTLREWTAEADVPLRPFAVCSDTKVGKRTQNEDISPYDLAFPATTDAVKLYARLIRRRGQGQADGGVLHLPVAASGGRGPAAGLPEFDLVICDEAHRTTGVTLAGEDESKFVRVHDQIFIQGTKRLYMTATPRIYDDASKAKADEGNAVLASMDDEELYGPEFHRLGFGEAVSRDLLTDYKVLVLAVDEEAVSTSFQAQLADENNELSSTTPPRSSAAGTVWPRRAGSESGFGDDRRADAPRRRVRSLHQGLAAGRPAVHRDRRPIPRHAGREHTGGRPFWLGDERLLRCEAQHVDGTFNALRRNERLDWLKAPLEPDTCRILSNARCLSEGVDVPALDAVMFLNPRKSVVDVVQSVGRVMRKAPGKEYGYIILPIGIPADMTPEQALSDNKRYKVVWQVLQALRAHDERFNAMVNQIELNKTKTDKLQVIGVSGFESGTETRIHAAGRPADAEPSTDRRVARRDLRQDRQEGRRPALLGRLGQGRRRHRRAHIDPHQGPSQRPHARRPRRVRRVPRRPARQPQRRHHRDDAIEMLAQHLITRPVFDALFEGYAFAEHNPVSQVMQRMLDILDDHDLDQENRASTSSTTPSACEPQGIDNAEGKQRIITELYEKFFKNAFPQTAEHSASSTRRSRSSTSSSVASSTCCRPSSDASLRRGRPHPRPLHRHRHLHRSAAPDRPDPAERLAAQVHRGAARQRDPAARLLHRRRSTSRRRSTASPATTTCRSTASSSPTPSR